MCEKTYHASEEVYLIPAFLKNIYPFTHTPDISGEMAKVVRRGF